MACSRLPPVLSPLIGKEPLSRTLISLPRAAASGGCIAGGSISENLRSDALLIKPTVYRGSAKPDLAADLQVRQRSVSMVLDPSIHGEPVYAQQGSNLIDLQQLADRDGRICAGRWEA
jgi:hypothetical protein